MRRWCAVVSLGLLALPGRAQELIPEKEAPVVGARRTAGPARMDPEEVARGLRVPPGFRVGVFARDLKNARMLAVAPDGAVYLTRRDQGDVLMLRDRDGDGKAEERQTVAKDVPFVHGIAIHQGQLYLAGVKEVHRAPIRPDGMIGPLKTIINDLPDGGQHPNRTIAFGADGMLYVSVGSTCNACNETNQENATLLRARDDGTDRGVYARGLRNTVAWAWHPGTGQLWGIDQGSDWRGDDVPPEEVNRIENAADYGWPHCWGDRRPDDHLANEPPGSTKEEKCPRTSAPVLELAAHGSPIQMKFYEGTQFPSEYRADAFVTLRGSWNRKQPSGYSVARLRFKDGQPSAVEDFVTSFLSPDARTYTARVAGLAVARDGSLLFTDDTFGVVYRVSYAGPGVGTSTR